VYPKLIEHLSAYKIKVYDRSLRKRNAKLEPAIVALNKRLEVIKAVTTSKVIDAQPIPKPDNEFDYRVENAGVVIGDESLVTERPRPCINQRKRIRPRKRTRTCRRCRDNNCRNMDTCPGSNNAQRCNCCFHCVTCIRNGCQLATSCIGKVDTCTCDCLKRKRRCMVCVNNGCQTAHHCAGRGGQQYHNCNCFH